MVHRHHGSETRLNSARHFPELDGVRGVAILFVLMAHTLPIDGVPVIGIYLAKLIGTMWMGVDLFFVLSGFLITRILIGLKETPGRWRIFYSRRTLRIFPLYFFVLTLTLWILPLFHFHDEIKTLQPMWPWFYGYSFNIWILLHNRWPASNMLNHFWSLAVEEQFYVFWPLVVFYIRPLRLPLAAMVVCAIAVISRLVLALNHFGWEPIYTNLFTRMDAFALGGLASWIYVYGDDEKWLLRAKYAFVAAAAVLTVMFFTFKGLPIPGGLLSVPEVSATAVLFSSAIYLTLRGEPHAIYRRVLGSRLLRFYGKYSYGLYVYHWMVLRFMCEDGPSYRLHYPRSGMSPIAVCVLTNSITLIIAWLSYNFFEIYFLKIRPKPAPKKMDEMPAAP